MQGIPAPHHGLNPCFSCMFYLLLSSGEKNKSTNWVLPSEMCISAFAITGKHKQQICPLLLAVCWLITAFFFVNLNTITAEPKYGCQTRCTVSVICLFLADSQAVKALCSSRQIKHVVYVSCKADSPNTVSNFIQLCTEGQFSLGHVVPVDLFPHTLHTELVLAFSR